MQTKINRPEDLRPGCFRIRPWVSTGGERGCLSNPCMTKSSLGVFALFNTPKISPSRWVITKLWLVGSRLEQRQPVEFYMVKSQAELKSSLKVDALNSSNSGSRRGTSQVTSHACSILAT